MHSSKVHTFWEYNCVQLTKINKKYKCVTFILIYYAKIDTIVVPQSYSIDVEYIMKLIFIVLSFKCQIFIQKLSKYLTSHF